MSKKYLLGALCIVALISVGVAYLVGSEPLSTVVQVTTCIPNYELDATHKLNPDRKTAPNDLAIVRQFNVQDQCPNGAPVKEIWVRAPNPYVVDGPSEKILYCENESTFLVLRDTGKVGNFYYYEGMRPCK